MVQSEFSLLVLVCISKYEMVIVHPRIRSSTSESDVIIEYPTLRCFSRQNVWQYCVTLYLASRIGKLNVMYGVITKTEPSVKLRKNLWVIFKNFS